MAIFFDKQGRGEFFDSYGLHLDFNGFTDFVIVIFNFSPFLFSKSFQFLYFRRWLIDARIGGQWSSIFIDPWDVSGGEMSIDAVLSRGEMSQGTELCVTSLYFVLLFEGSFIPGHSVGTVCLYSFFF